jgi:hypothetical protein
MIKDSRLKDSALDDSADIYKQRDVKTEKEKLSEMTSKEKLEYFNSYYRNKTIAILAILAFIIYAVYSMLTPKPETVLYAAVINYALDEESAVTLQEDMGKILNINPKTEEIMIDTSFYMGTEGDVSQFSLSNQQKLGTYFYAGDIDVLIAPESDFAGYAYNGTFSKISDQLPTDLYTKLTDSFYFSDLEEDATKNAYGIYLDGAKIYNNAGELIEKPVLGIVANSKHKENAIELIRHLFDIY